jgi:predicted acyl esterase
MSGSSAGATTTFAAASTRHPSLRAFFAQAGGSSIYDDVIYEGQGIEMERLWLWVAKNIPGLSKSHREAVLARFGIGAAELDRAAISATERYNRLDAARLESPPFINSADWLHLPLTAYPDSPHGRRSSMRSSPIRPMTHSAPGTISAGASTSPAFTSPAGSTSFRPA